MVNEFVELFAGCGGLSLGLKSEGFDFLFANELSPMASETYAYNFLGEDLRALVKKKGMPRSTKWLNSNYSLEEIGLRLKENTLEYPVFGQGYNDLELDKGIEGLLGNLLVGSIVDLNLLLKSTPGLCQSLQERDIDLVSGGPPCQSFSTAGLRDLNNHRNLLPLEFLNFVSMVKPKIALLENVTGILRPFTSKIDGLKHHAWFEVAKAFATKEYFPVCMHVNAKYVGVAQNRPRFIMFALRGDVFNNLKARVDETLRAELDHVGTFVNKVQENEIMLAPSKDLKYYDIETIKGREFYKYSIFSPLYTHRKECQWVPVSEAIGDLICHNASTSTGIKSKYVKRLLRDFPKRSFNSISGRGLANHVLRRNGPRVRQRFHLLQVLSKGASQEVIAEVSHFLKDPENQSISGATCSFFNNFEFLGHDGESYLTLDSMDEVKDYLATLKTRKHSQKVLFEKKPAPATMSIPDDYCHYEPGILRTLSVREMARIQSFPDWYMFRSKETTGGALRKYEVPQYTQVGNAVPPLLGKALGKVANRILGG